MCLGPRASSLTWVYLTQLLPLSPFLTTSGVCFSLALMALSHAIATHRVCPSELFPHVVAEVGFPTCAFMTLRVPRLIQLPHGARRSARGPRRVVVAEGAASAVSSEQAPGGREASATEVALRGSACDDQCPRARSRPGSFALGEVRRWWIPDSATVPD
jgi:hypothetical protein